MPQPLEKRRAHDADSNNLRSTVYFLKSASKSSRPWSTAASTSRPALVDSGRSELGSAKKSQKLVRSRSWTQSAAGSSQLRDESDQND